MTELEKLSKKELVVLINRLLTFIDADQLELSTHTTRCLEGARIRTIADLIRVSPSELLAKNKFSQKAIKEITKALTEVGLALKDNNT